MQHARLTVAVAGVCDSQVLLTPNDEWQSTILDNRPGTPGSPSDDQGNLPEALGAQAMLASDFVKGSTTGGQFDAIRQNTLPVG